MEAVAAVGVAAAAVQFYTFVVDVYPKIRELLKSPTGDLEWNKAIAEHGQRIKNLCSKVKNPPFPQGQIPSEALAVPDALQARIESLQRQCVSISDELQADLGQLQVEIKSDGSKSKRSLAKVMFKTQFGGKSSAQLLSKLDRLQKDLDSSLLADISRSLQRVGSENNASFLCLSRNIDDIAKAIAQDTTDSSCLIHTSQKILDLIATEFAATRLESSRKDYRDKLLQSLWFQDMFARQETVTPAYRQTFQWILETESVDAANPSTSLRTGNWTNTFRPWLRERSTVDGYWIQGVAGSGKSTLLNVIHEHPNLEEHLKYWSNGESVTRASFFIWKSGTDVQRAHTSLYRALAYQLIDANPQSLATLSAANVGLNNSRPESILTWTEQRLQKVLFHLLEHCGYIFLLVDGLDEASEPFDNMLLFLRRLAKLPKVKLCVSSRDAVVFEKHLGSFEFLRLHDLTYYDIKEMVNDRLKAESEDRSLTNKLAKNVCWNAQGVFLWAQLVVDGLIEGIRNGDTTYELFHRLNSIPAGLEALYESMFESVNPEYRKQTGLYFGLVGRWQNLCSILPDFGMFGEAEGLALAMLSDDPTTDFTARSEGVFTHQESCSTFKAAEGVYQRLKSRVMSRSRGLLLIRSNRGYAYRITMEEQQRILHWVGGYVQIMHRTVRDFIMLTDVGRSLVPVPARTELDKLLLERYFKVYSCCVNQLGFAWHWWIRNADLIACVERETGKAQIDMLESLSDQIINSPRRADPICWFRFTRESFRDYVNHVVSTGSDSTHSKARIILAVAYIAGMDIALQSGVWEWNEHDIQEVFLRVQPHDCHDLFIFSFSRGLTNQDFQNAYRGRQRSLIYLLGRLSVDPGAAIVYGVEDFWRHLQDWISFHFEFAGFEFANFLKRTFEEDSDQSDEILKMCEACRPFIPLTVRTGVPYHPVSWTYFHDFPHDISISLNLQFTFVDYMNFISPRLPIASKILKTLGLTLKSEAEAQACIMEIHATYRGNGTWRGKDVDVSSRLEAQKVLQQLWRCFQDQDKSTLETRKSELKSCIRNFMMDVFEDTLGEIDRGDELEKINESDGLRYPDSIE